MKLRIAMTLLTASLCGVAAAGNPPPDVRDMMTANQFHATGLDKLAPGQLTAFDAWLAGYSYPTVAQKAPDVRDLVSARQFQTIGFDKLTPEELAAFNAWLADYRPASAAAVVPAGPTPAPSAASGASFGQEMLTTQEHHDPDRIESSIVGTINGWNGRTTFKLANGQVWQQADGSTSDLTLHDPQVVIKRLAFGYLLTFPGQGATVFVRRIH